jgi:hypothetical protein
LISRIAEGNVGAGCGVPDGVLRGRGMEKEAGVFELMDFKGKASGVTRFLVVPS